MKGQSSTEYLANFAIVFVIILGTVYALNNLGIGSLTSAVHERTQKVSARIETLGVDSWNLMQDGTFHISIINNGDIPLNITKLSVSADIIPKEPDYGNPATDFCDSEDYNEEEHLLYPNARLTVRGRFDNCAGGQVCDFSCDHDISLNAPYKLRVEIDFKDVAEIPHSVYKIIDGRVQRTII